jgi:hypothetical protein
VRRRSRNLNVEDFLETLHARGARFDAYPHARPGCDAKRRRSDTRDLVSGSPVLVGFEWFFDGRQHLLQKMRSAVHSRRLAWSGQELAFLLSKGLQRQVPRKTMTPMPRPASRINDH